MQWSGGTQLNIVPEDDQTRDVSILNLDESYSYHLQANTDTSVDEDH